MQSLRADMAEWRIGSCNKNVVNEQNKLPVVSGICVITKQEVVSISALLTFIFLADKLQIS